LIKNDRLFGNHENSKHQNTNLKKISMTEIQNSKQIKGRQDIQVIEMF